jgi:hypothetical protein
MHVTSDPSSRGATKFRASQTSLTPSKPTNRVDTRRVKSHSKWVPLANTPLSAERHRVQKRRLRKQAQFVCLRPHAACILMTAALTREHKLSSWVHDRSQPHRIDVQARCHISTKCNRTCKSSN